MAKKRRQTQLRGNKKAAGCNRGLTSSSKTQARARTSKDSAKRSIGASANRPPSTTQSGSKPDLPFSTQQHPKPSLLLLGEGDFSHAISLLRTYYTDRTDAVRVTATAYDKEDEVLTKYPQAEAFLEELRLGGCEIMCGVDAGDLKKTLGVWKKSVLASTAGLVSKVDEEEEEGEEEEEEEEEEWDGFTDEADEMTGERVDEVKSIDETTDGHRNTSNHVRSTETAALQGTANQARRHRRVYDRIIFNFPHVGGKASGHSTDVNRQVRANQALLVRLFEAVKPFLAPRRSLYSHNATAPPRSPSEDGDEDDSVGGGEGQTFASYAGNEGGGQLIVTLFEGEPYTLWNIRDLARHTGYRVIRSFRFPWDAYPGYSHARTLGNIRSRVTQQNGTSHERDIVGGPDTKKRAWKGEEREARSFVFELAELETGATKRGDSRISPKRKRARDADTSDSDE